MVLPPWTEACRLILRINWDIPGSIESVRGFFFARTLDKQFFKEKEDETRTGTFEDDSSVDQGLGWLPDSHAGNHDAF